MIAFAHVLAAAVAGTTSAAAIHVDVTGDGVRDLVEAHGTELTIRSTSGISTASVGGRLDGAFTVHGAGGALLLVRASAGRSGVVDALYRVHRGRIERVHVEGMAADGLVSAFAGRAYVDIDCGADARTVVQVEETPTPHGWRETVLTFRLRQRLLTLVGVTEKIVTHTRTRRCAVLRR
jgi:hypothetical protein